MPYFERHTTAHDWVWAGQFSMCHMNGPIVKFLQDQLNTIPFAIIQGDGIMTEKNLTLAIFDKIDLEKLSLENSAIGVLCTRDISHPNMILLPLDDTSFEKGVWDSVSDHIERIPWESKKSIAYWRGCLSGGKAPTVRTRVVWDLHDFPHADAKLTRNLNMDPEHMGRLLFPEDTRFYDQARSLQEHIQHKYILILDGNCIASALQWVFASGSVPILITHPGNNWWFSKFLIEGYHYISVDYDLSNLRQVIQYLVEHDEYAHDVATHAMEFAKTVLSSEFQHGYLMKEIKRITNV
jgi:hypothetical protein